MAGLCRCCKRSQSASGSANARNAEVDSFEQCAPVWRFRKRRQGIARDGAEMARPLHRVLNRAMGAHQTDGMVEIAVADLTLLQGTSPEDAVGVGSAAVGQDDGEGDLA